MIGWLQKTWQSLMGGSNDAHTAVHKRGDVPRVKTLDLDMAPDDPFMAYLLSVSGVVELDRVEVNSPVLKSLREAGVKITVPLISQGELIGLLNLGPRLSEQDYSSDDRRLLATLATQAAPALRVAQLARQQQAEARERERMEQELRVARVIQETLLPKEIPAMQGWKIYPHWQPARAVSGDFYDFIEYPDGKLGFVEADVTDKGVPAALVMATTRSILRSNAENLESPGLVLEQVNNLLCPDIPPKMFVTCLYAVLDPESGILRFANAGHNIPYVRTAGGLVEVIARGMPLGLMPGMKYEEKEIHLQPGDTLLITSDGLVEAHNSQRDMFGFQRVKSLVAENTQADVLIKTLMRSLAEFTGPEYEQEDDITLLVLERDPLPELLDSSMDKTARVLANFSLPSQPGNEREAAEKVLAALKGVHVPERRLRRLETAVAEATMNAMEHGNHYQADVPVTIQVLETDDKLVTRITDQGGEHEIHEVEAPDLDAKLAGEQSPRGWGLFLIRNMVDEINITGDGVQHTVELVLNLKEGEYDQTL